MAKKIAAFLVALCLILTFTPYVAAEDDFTLPASLDKPLNLTVRDNDGQFLVRWTNPDSIMKLLSDIEGEGHTVFLAIDWKLNNGAWNIALSPAQPGFDEETGWYFIDYISNLQTDDNNVSERFFVTWHFVADSFEPFDLKNDTYTFRARYILENYDDEIPPIFSPYSNEIAIGKNAAQTTVTKLDAPQNLSVKVEKDSHGKPYFALNWTIPESINEINKTYPVYHQIDFKVGDGQWISETFGESMASAPSRLLVSNATLDPVEKEYVNEVVVEENIYHFRVLFECETAPDTIIRSSFSNVASTKTEGYKRASDWAVGELDKADGYDLIPDSIRNDMQAPITRQEFAELALRLYEKTLKVTVPAATEDNFTDTDHPEVLKAFKLGIVKGVNTEMTLFAPNLQINRQECATMLGRTLEIMVPDGDFSIEGAPVFSDEKDIDSWAYQYVKFMSKIGVIKGANGKFMPKAVTDREKAEGYATATREQAVIMSMRIFEAYAD